jgi:sugar phosphate isomerase/epimerase
MPFIGGAAVKLGFASLIGIEPAPFCDIVQWAAEHEFTAIEVNVGSSFPAIGTAAFSGHLNIAAIVRDGPGEIPELLARHGVEIASLAPCCAYASLF